MTRSMVGSILIEFVQYIGQQTDENPEVSCSEPSRSRLQLYRMGL